MVAVPGKPARKVKTGCFTCKARRVKCDEERPYCRRCVSGGRKCEGYYATTSLNSERRAEPPLALSLLPDCSDQEKRYFHLYHVVTVPSLCAYFGSNFWTILVPQVSIREPAVRHSLLALSALHESISYPGGPEHLKDRTNPSTILAVGHYNRAIRSLIGKDNQISSDTLLLCCVVFVCVELLRGDVKAALNHIQSGLKILQDARSKTASPRPFCISSHPSSLDDSLDTVFARLDVQSMFLGSTPQLVLAAPNASHPNNSPPSTASGLPFTFSNLPEARAHFETLLSSNYRFMRAYPGLQPGDVLSQEAAEAHTIEILKLRAWSDAFAPLFEGSKTCSPSIQRAAQILKIQHMSSMIWAHAHHRRSEADFGAYTEEFASIVDLSRKVIGGNGQHALTSGSLAPMINSAGGNTRPDFAFDSGVMPSLHLTAMKCRVSRIRHEALNLLQLTPRQEGVCDRAFVTKLTAYSIEVEEAADRAQHINNTGYDDERRPSLSHMDSLSSQGSDYRPQSLPDIQVNQQISYNTPQLADTWLPRVAIFSDQQTERELSSNEFAQSDLCVREKPSPQQEDAVWSIAQERAVRADWQQTHANSDGLLEVRGGDRPWDMSQQGVARRASGGNVTETKGGIMGFDANNSSYSFDYRGV